MHTITLYTSTDARLNTREMAEYLGVSPATVRRWCNHDPLIFLNFGFESRRVGGRWFFTPAEDDSDYDW